jgi:hypothetical protein
MEPPSQWWRITTCPLKRELWALLQSSPDEIFTVGDRLLGFAYIPKSSIVYLETGDVIVR